MKFRNLRCDLSVLAVFNSLARLFWFRSWGYEGFAMIDERC